jgi:hypothetical protein
MVNYQDGKIYKITGGNSLPYIGSTCVTLSRRLAKHNTNKKCYKEKNILNNCGSFDLLELEDCKIELIELFPCSSKRELEIRERYWFDLIPNININKPYLSREENLKNHNEYYKKNKIDMLEKSKQYYLKNKEHIEELKNKYFNCECGLHYTHSNRARHFKSKTHINYLEKSQEVV